MTSRKILCAAFCAAVLVPCLLSQRATRARPAILGVAHIALKTNDLAAARAFYGHDLGFAEPFPGPNGSAVFKVNDRQYIEVAATLHDDSEDRLDHIAFETANARQLLAYFTARGVAILHPLDQASDSDLTFAVADPEGHTIQFVEYRSSSLTGRNRGKALPDTRISDHIIHGGFILQDQAAANRFYADILGFHEFWKGGMTETRFDWVDMGVPDGHDWLEYMLNQPHPTTRVRGIMNHLALGVPDAQAAYKRLQDRGVKMTEAPKIGRDGKWQLNLYDPNLTRAELMEPKPVQTPCCSTMLDH